MGWLWEVVVDVAQGVVFAVLVLLWASTAAAIFLLIMRSMGFTA
jgi:hypothetical protein